MTTTEFRRVVGRRYVTEIFDWARHLAPGNRNIYPVARYVSMLPDDGSNSYPVNHFVSVLCNAKFFVKGPDPNAVGKVVLFSYGYEDDEGQVSNVWVDCDFLENDEDLDDEDIEAHRLTVVSVQELRTLARACGFSAVARGQDAAVTQWGTDVAAAMVVMVQQIYMRGTEEDEMGMAMPGRLTFEQLYGIEGGGSDNDEDDDGEESR